MDYYEKLWKLMIRDEEVVKEIGKSKDWLDGFEEGFDFALTLIEQGKLKPLKKKILINHLSS